jgi:hypothetical protein
MAPVAMPMLAHGQRPHHAEIVVVSVLVAS